MVGAGDPRVDSGSAAGADEEWPDVVPGLSAQAGNTENKQSRTRAALRKYSTDWLPRRIQSKSVTLSEMMCLSARLLRKGLSRWYRGTVF
jgi:hypothetical protein